MQAVVADEDTQLSEVSEYYLEARLNISNTQEFNRAQYMCRMSPMQTWGFAEAGEGSKTC